MTDSWGMRRPLVTPSERAAWISMLSPPAPRLRCPWLNRETFDRAVAKKLKSVCAISWCNSSPWDFRTHSETLLTAEMFTVPPLYVLWAGAKRPLWDCLSFELRGSRPVSRNHTHRSGSAGKHGESSLGSGPIRATVRPLSSHVSSRDYIGRRWPTGTRYKLTGSTVWVMMVLFMLDTLEVPSKCR